MIASIRKYIGMTGLYRPFDEVYETLPPKGWLSRTEAEVLYWYATKAEGPILEIGSYHGRSTVLLASLLRPLYCIDPFAGFDTDDPTGDIAYNALTEHLKFRGLEKGVTILRTRAEDIDVQKHGIPEVGLAYLDGDHTYKGTLVQINLALSLKAQWIIMHDVNDHGGGLEVKQAAIEQLGPWRNRVERIAVWKL